MSFLPEDLPFWLGLVRFRPFGALRLGRLEQGFPSMQKAFEASRDALIACGIEAPIAKAFCEERSAIDPQKEWEDVQAQGVQIVSFEHPLYPSLLKTIYDPPPFFFVRGTLPDPARQTLAVVGSRQPSLYGKQVVRRLIEPLAQSPLVIVSGLAYGIDALAHTVTLDAGGTTIAILGSGLDDATLYPQEHLPLAKRIITQGGAVVSEFPLRTPPLKQHFPFRNRLIAGWCQGTLIIEAHKKSGSLITARAALDAGRDVYAVPGPITSLLSEGPNNLLKMGAIPVSDPTDIFPTLVEMPISAKTYQPTTKEESSLLSFLSLDPKHIDVLIEETHLPASAVSSTLTLLEMKGIVKHMGSQYYIRVTLLA